MDAWAYDRIVEILASENPKDFTVNDFTNCPARVLARELLGSNWPTDALRAYFPANAINPVWEYIIDPFDYGEDTPVNERLQRVCDALASTIED